MNQDPTENYIKFGFSIKGSSGDLNTSVIADYLTHRELTILESERCDYFEQRKSIQKQLTDRWIAKDKKTELETKQADLDSNYVPIDFDSYTIEDAVTDLEKQDSSFAESDKIWRISSLTAFIDADTKILLLPMPESKRTTKVKDTAYSFQKVADLIAAKKRLEEQLGYGND